ncbi:MAG: TldD/PmbA family protein [Spirochaetia bacterium]|nr:TldD/PmbA family protein [Spirochaetia bacterium]
MLDKKDGAARLNAAGFSIWDIFEENSVSLQIVYEDNRAEKAVSGTDNGIGIRGIKDGMTSYGFANDEAGAAGVIERLTSGAGEAVEFKRAKPGFINRVAIDPASVEFSKKMRMLEEVNAFCRAFSPYVKQVSISYGERRQQVEIASDSMELAGDTRTYTNCGIMVIAEKAGRIETGYTVLAGHRGFELFDNGALLKKAEEAASLAVRLLDVDAKITGEMTAVISSSAGGTMIHEAVGHSLEADLVQKGLSQYAGKKGGKVASDVITVVDDATIEGRRGSFSFDDEGIPSQRTVLIENGILKNYMYDRETAAKDAVLSTGNGRRESYRFKPIPRMRNTMIAPSTGTACDLVRDTKSGIFVVRMGGGQVNTVTGEVVFEGMEGYRIENGEVGTPVRGATLMGTGVGVLNTIDAVCSDLGFDAGTCGKDGQGVPVADAQPTLRIPKILVGSK